MSYDDECGICMISELKQYHFCEIMVKNDENGA